jgi:hypothetical protein
MSPIRVGQSSKGAIMTPYIMTNLVFLGDEFVFIPIKSPNDCTAKRLARSHAVAHGLRSKRRRQQTSGHNFYVLCPENNQSRPAREKKQAKSLITQPASLTTGSDPFQMLAAESPTLRALLNRGKILEII